MRRHLAAPRAHTHTCARASPPQCPDDSGGWKPSGHLAPSGTKIKKKENPATAVCWEPAHPAPPTPHFPSPYHPRNCQSCRTVYGAAWKRLSDCLWCCPEVAAGLSMALSTCQTVLFGMCSKQASRGVLRRVWLSYRPFVRHYLPRRTESCLLCVRRHAGVCRLYVTGAWTRWSPLVHR